MIDQKINVPLWHKGIEWTIRVLAWTACVAIVLIFVFVLREAAPLLMDPHFDLNTLFMPQQWKGYEQAAFVWQPVGAVPKYNFVPLIIGTLKITLLSMALSFPIAVGCAIYVSQYTPRRSREWLKPLVELLAGVPSVVLGFFAMGWLSHWVSEVFHPTYRLNVVVAAMGLSLAVIPVIFTVSEDALSRVPKAYAEASFALGAHRFQTILNVLMPAAFPGIIAATMLGFGRAIGETMIVLMASGNAAVGRVWDWTSSGRTLTATIASELGEVARGETHWKILFLLGALLFVMTFAVNWVGRFWVERLQRQWSSR